MKLCRAYADNFDLDHDSSWLTEANNCNFQYCKDIGLDFQNRRAKAVTFVLLFIFYSKLDQLKLVQRKASKNVLPK